MDTQLSEWLQTINLKFGKEDIPYIRRPFEAISRLGLEFGISVSMPSPFADELFHWFEERSPVGAHAIGSLFTSSFYYDAYFWRVEIPIGHGIVQLNALDALGQMPAYTKKQLQNDSQMMWKYFELWIDSIDYAFGIDDLGNGIRLPAPANQGFGAHVTASADRELMATVQLLTEQRTPNSKAWETARMATEMFMKAYLAVHAGLDENAAQKNFGHDLKKLAEACLKAKGQIEFNELLRVVIVFPQVSARYQADGYSNEQLWSSFAVALKTAVTFTRSLTDRDSRDTIRVQSHGSMSNP